MKYQKWEESERWGSQTKEVESEEETKRDAEQTIVKNKSVKGGKEKVVKQERTNLREVSERKERI